MPFLGLTIAFDGIAVFPTPVAGVICDFSTDLGVIVILPLEDKQERDDVMFFIEEVTGTVVRVDTVVIFVDLVFVAATCVVEGINCLTLLTTFDEDFVVGMTVFETADSTTFPLLFVTMLNVEIVLILPKELLQVKILV